MRPAKPAADRIAEGFYRTGLYNGAASNDAYIESASFIKLRELNAAERQALDAKIRLTGAFTAKELADDVAGVRRLVEHRLDRRFV